MTGEVYRTPFHSAPPHALQLGSELRHKIDWHSRWAPHIRPIAALHLPRRCRAAASPNRPQPGFYPRKREPPATLRCCKLGTIKDPCAWVTTCPLFPLHLLEHRLCVAPGEGLELIQVAECRLVDIHRTDDIATGVDMRPHA